MKKKWLTAILAVGLITVSASPALAAETNAEVKVLVDGTQLTFEVPPTIQDGTTVVQFRPIFEKLGLTIGWNEETRTVTGSKTDLQVELQIGNDQATINGQSFKLAQAPSIVNDSTVVPLRFVGEASGKDVNWDGYTKTIRIASAEANIKTFVADNVMYTESEDLLGALSAMDETAQNLEASAAMMKQIFTLFKLDYELNSVSVQDVKNDSATAVVDMTVKKTEGPDFKNNRSITHYQLHKINGSWKISGSSISKTNFLNEDKYKDEKPAIAESDRKVILELVENIRTYSENENFDALLKLYDPEFPNLENVMTTSKYLAAAFYLKFELSNVTIIQSKDNTVTVRFTEKISKVSGPAFNNTLVDGVLVLRKQADGAWKMFKDDIISTEAVN